jgi:hypothetical protein
MKTKKELIEKWQSPNASPVIFTCINGQDIAIKDESQNITDTYKARHGWMMGLHYLENHFPDPFVYYIISTGNAGLADFVFADKLNELIGEQKITVVNFYPKDYDSKILGPDSEGRFTDGKKFREIMDEYKSGRIIQVDFSKKLSENFCLEEMVRHGIDVENCLDITEGFNPTYTQVMKEFIQQIKEKYGHIPRTLAIIQFGAGMLYDDSKAVAGDLIDFVAVSTGNKETIADKICDSAGIWQENLHDLREKGFTRAKNTGDKIFHVEEQEILYAMAQFKELGIEAEPSGAAAMAMTPRFGSYDLIAVINTGNGIKKCAYKSVI